MGGRGGEEGRRRVGRTLFAMTLTIDAIRQILLSSADVRDPSLSTQPSFRSDFPGDSSDFIGEEAVNESVYATYICRRKRTSTTPSCHRRPPCQVDVIREILSSVQWTQ
jgi:hypothetical protein